MAVTEQVAFGKTTVYDEEGRTMVPEDIRKAMGIERGDKLKFIHEDGFCAMFVEKKEDDE